MLAEYTPSFVALFWSKVERTESCWLWMAGKNVSGYGHTSIKSGNGRIHLISHRVSWELHNGSIPDDMDVLHNCPDGDNPACVNPAHLWLGTHSDNMLDMYRKGRHRVVVYAPGESNPMAKLTRAKAAEIRRRFVYGDPIDGVAPLAKEFGVSEGCIRHVIRGDRWATPNTDGGRPPDGS